MVTKMKHISFEGRLRELRLLSLEKRRLQRDLTAPSSPKWGLVSKKDEEDFILWPLMTGEGTTVLQVKEGRFRVAITTKLFKLEETVKDHLVPTPAMGKVHLLPF